MKDTVCDTLLFGFELWGASYAVKKRARSYVAEINDEFGEEKDDDVEQSFCH
jgi:hypothetical protein